MRLLAFMRVLWPALVCAALIVLVVFGAPALGVIDERVATNVTVNVALVIGLFIFVGLTGVFSFGHAGFMALGAYCFALLTIPTAVKNVVLTATPDFIVNASLGVAPGIIAGGLLAAVVAAILSLPLMRMSALGSALATLVVLIVVNVVARNWQPVTNGTTGLTAIPTARGPGDVIVWALLAVAVAFAFQASRRGLLARASREDEVAAAAVGVNVANARRLAFVVSAFVLGVGGALYAYFLGSFTPDAFYLNITFLTLAMLIIGGRASLSGAVVGALAVSLASEFLRQVEDGTKLGPIELPARPGLSNVVLALAMLAVLLLRPRGLLGDHEFTFPRWLGLRERDRELALQRPVGQAFTDLAKRRTSEQEVS